MIVFKLAGSLFFFGTQLINGANNRGYTNSLSREPGKGCNSRTGKRLLVVNLVSVLLIYKYSIWTFEYYYIAVWKWAINVLDFKREAEAYFHFQLLSFISRAMSLFDWMRDNRVWLGLVCLRLALVFLPQSGYIHPDEFFQSPEIVAGIPLPLFFTYNLCLWSLNSVVVTFMSVVISVDMWHCLIFGLTLHVHPISGFILFVYFLSFISIILYVVPLTKYPVIINVCIVPHESLFWMNKLNWIDNIYMYRSNSLDILPVYKL